MRSRPIGCRWRLKGRFTRRIRAGHAKPGRSGASGRNVPPPPPRWPPWPDAKGPGQSARRGRPGPVGPTRKARRGRPDAEGPTRKARRGRPDRIPRLHPVRRDRGGPLHRQAGLRNPCAPPIGPPLQRRQVEPAMDLPAGPGRPRPQDRCAPRSSLRWGVPGLSGLPLERRRFAPPGRPLMPDPSATGRRVGTQVPDHPAAWRCGSPPRKGPQIRTGPLPPETDPSRSLMRAQDDPVAAPGAVARPTRPCRRFGLRSPHRMGSCDPAPAARGRLRGPGQPPAGSGAEGRGRP